LRETERGDFGQCTANVQTSRDNEIYEYACEPTHAGMDSHENPPIRRVQGPATKGDRHVVLTTNCMKLRYSLLSIDVPNIGIVLDKTTLRYTFETN